MTIQKIYKNNANFFEAVDTVCFECGEGGENTCACDNCPVRHTVDNLLRSVSDHNNK